jgi:hypothetical protein
VYQQENEYNLTVQLSFLHLAEDHSSNDHECALYYQESCLQGEVALSIESHPDLDALRQAEINLIFIFIIDCTHLVLFYFILILTCLVVRVRVIPA